VVENLRHLFAGERQGRLFSRSVPSDVSWANRRSSRSRGRNERSRADAPAFCQPSFEDAPEITDKFDRELIQADESGVCGLAKLFGERAVLPHCWVAKSPRLAFPAKPFRCPVQSDSVRNLAGSQFALLVFSMVPGGPLEGMTDVLAGVGRSFHPHRSTCRAGNSDPSGRGPWSAFPACTDGIIVHRTYAGTKRVIGF
jgi:hypothetical protein